MAKQHIPVYADPETKRRVEQAAAKHQVSVGEYCLDAIQQRLADDELLDVADGQLALSSDFQNDDSLIAELRALRMAISEEREGQPIDVSALIEQIRDERDYEITGLH